MKRRLSLQPRTSHCERRARASGGTSGALRIIGQARAGGVRGSGPDRPRSRRECGIFLGRADCTTKAPRLRYASDPARYAKECSLMIKLFVNGKQHSVDADPEMPLLWALRENLQLTGTKFGCGMALCGACTVHLDGEAVRSCSTPLSAAAGKQVTSIEGIGASRIGKQVQNAWTLHDVPQCGYCQSGQIMSACALLAQQKRPSDEQIDAAMSGNICRCGTYNQIRAAIKDAAANLQVRGV
jgi:isoquinoline 1-oxidoreductase alpha subunit